MLNNFIYAQTKALFEEHLLAGNILDEAVVFIEDTKEIWNHGTYFGGADVSKLENSIEGLSEAIAALQSGKQDTITDLETIRNNANKGATALQSFTETDPIFSASVAANIKESDITNWNSKTSNTGTVTGIKMNGSTKGTSGIVDLGTVITEHQDISGKANVSDLNAHTENTTIHVTSSDKSKWNSAESNAKTYADGLNTSMDARVSAIEETLPEPERRLTTVENYTVPDARNKVLWIGTSIPAGDIQHGDTGTTNLGSNNYPKMVADALGFTLYNNARGSSFVCFYPSSEDGTAAWAGKDWSEYSSEVWKGYSLSASHAQIDEKFQPLGVPEWLINSFKRYSYESLIIPYIDGTIASCDTVVIDHGYNDRSVIINEASWHPGDGETQFAAGSGRQWLEDLCDPLDSKMVSETYFQGKWCNDESVSSKKHYIAAMIFLVKKIWAVNPRIKIIIGNYFATKSNVFSAEFGSDRLGEFVCLANTAIASWLRVNCVEVWKHTGIYNRNLPAGNDYQLFCPDGVHPHSDSTGHSNKIIAGVYINAIRGTLYI